MTGLHPDIVRRATKRVGQTLRRKYTLDRLLGVGGAGAVFAATHRNGTRVAVKVLHSELARSADMRARFLREGYVANKIAHRGIVRILDDDDDDDERTVFLVMELLEGESLDSRWERFGRRFPLEEALERADDLLDVLNAAHAQGVIHRDVKPENVFLTTDGSLKVLDFGIARLLDGSGATRSGEVFGTPAFMPPEQASGQVRAIDPRSDVWSVGALLFTLLTGAEVHESTNVMQQMILAGTQRARPVSTVSPGILPELAHVIDRALAFEKQDRWPSALSMQAALRATGSYTPRASDVPRPTLPASPPLPATTGSASTGAGTETLMQGSGQLSAQRTMTRKPPTT